MFGFSFPWAYKTEAKNEFVLADTNILAIIMPETSMAIDLFDISHIALHQTNKTTTNLAEALINGYRKDFTFFPTYRNLIFSSVNK